MSNSKPVVSNFEGFIETFGNDIDLKEVESYRLCWNLAIGSAAYQVEMSEGVDFEIREDLMSRT